MDTFIQDIRSKIEREKSALRIKAIEQLADELIDFAESTHDLSGYGLNVSATKKAEEIFNAFKLGE